MMVTNLLIHGLWIWNSIFQESRDGRQLLQCELTVHLTYGQSKVVLPVPLCLEMIRGHCIVTSQCSNLQTCYQCGVECSGSVLFGVNQSECIAYIDQTTTFIVEYHPSETRCVLGTCSGIDYRSPLSYSDVRAFRYTCTTECLTFSFEEIKLKKIGDAPSSAISVPRAQCIELCFDIEYCYMWAHKSTSTCYFYSDCGPYLSCSTTFSLSQKVFKRTCFESCDAPQAPANGNVTYQETTEGSTAFFSCDEGFVEVTGSYTQTCLGNGTWSLPQPVCITNETTSTTTTSTSTTTTTSLPTTTAMATTSTTTLPPSTSAQMTTDSPTATSSTNLTTSSSTITQNTSSISTSPKTAAKIYIMPCICNENKTFTGKTNEEIIEILIKETKIDVKSTSLAKNKLMSREDNRPTSQVIGYVGLCFLIIAFGCIIVSDAYILVVKLNGSIFHHSPNSN